jgi:hypothetical protein
MGGTILRGDAGELGVLGKMLIRRGVGRRTAGPVLWSSGHSEPAAVDPWESARH